MPESLAKCFATFSNQLALLSDSEEPPQTTLQILGREQQEQDWQRLLFYFLKPDQPHGLDYDFLEHLLDALARRDDISYSFTRFDLDEIQIDLEVILSNDRRPDAMIWAGEDWFICWELKVNAIEGDDQTSDYVRAASFRTIDLIKDEVPVEEHHYVYLAPESADQPNADEFVHVSWEWIADQIQSFVTDSDGIYPSRTTSQLNDFVSTIRSELTMTQYQENQQEKVELYIDYFDELTEVQDAFDDAWDELTNTWGESLASTIDSVRVIDTDDGPSSFLPVELELNDGTVRQWIFRHEDNDWAWTFPPEWWRDLEEDESFYTYSPGRTQARVGFLHRLQGNRTKALRDRELKFYLRNAPASHDAFHEGFTRRFNQHEDIPDMLPSTTIRTEKKANLLEATYPINVEIHDDFFDAYIAALASAIEDHIINNSQLIATIDQIFEETIDEDTPF